MSGPARILPMLWAECQIEASVRQVISDAAQNISWGTDKPAREANVKNGFDSLMNIGLLQFVLN